MSDPMKTALEKLKPCKRVIAEAQEPPIAGESFPWCWTIIVIAIIVMYFMFK